MRFLSILSYTIFLLLAGCGDGSNNSSKSDDTAAEKTTKQKIANLEASGTYPKLDRSDSLAGPDVNANGVRDDVETYINSQSHTALQKQSELQLARSLQEEILAGTGDKATLDAIDLRAMRSVHCLAERFPNGFDSDNILTSLEKITTNTKARIIAYLEFSHNRNGTVSSVLTESSCD